MAMEANLAPEFLPLTYVSCRFVSMYASYNTIEHLLTSIPTTLSNPAGG